MLRFLQRYTHFMDFLIPLMSISWLKPTILLILFAIFVAGSITLPAQEKKDSDIPNDEELISEAEVAQLEESLSALSASLELQSQLQRDIKQLRRELKATREGSEKQRIEAALLELENSLKTATLDYQFIAAKTDLSPLQEQEESSFNFQKEMAVLLKPALDEIKQMTKGIRQKSELRERITLLQQQQTVLADALTSIEKLIEHAKNKQLSRQLQQTQKEWQEEHHALSTQLQTAELQLNTLSVDSSLVERSRAYFKEFFQKRGLYILIAIISVLSLFFSLRLFYRFLVSRIPGFKKAKRDFKLRLFELLCRMLSFILLIITPVIVFYSVEDWLLLSLMILFLIGISWTFTKGLASFWQQVQLFLNIGAVREGERLFLDNIPWRVKRINIFTELENPVAQLTQRVPIKTLTLLKSRPIKPEEPWFPCMEGDWVLLEDGNFGKVTGISQELIRLVNPGGAHQQYTLLRFLELSPTNLSTNFRIFTTVHLSYSLQNIVTSEIPEKLTTYIMERLIQAGYQEVTLNVQTEFERVNSSSLDIVVLSDFSGACAKDYQKLLRAIPGWCVDACHINGWEMPLSQMVLHRSKPAISFPG